MHKANKKKNKKKNAFKNVYVFFHKTNIRNFPVHQSPSILCTAESLKGKLVASLL